MNLTATDRCLIIEFKNGGVTVGLHGTGWIASSETGLSVSYAGDAFLGVQISHGLPDPLLGHVPVKKKMQRQTLKSIVSKRENRSLSCSSGNVQGICHCPLQDCW